MDNGPDANLQKLLPLARAILHRHGYSTTGLRYLGAGEQSICYGAGRHVVLVDSGQTPMTSNNYRLQQWLAAQAARAGVRSPLIVAVGDDPCPYALMQRAMGDKASACESTLQEELPWFFHMGEEVRKINEVSTTGFGDFLPCGSQGYCGRYASWGDYLDAVRQQYLFPDGLSEQARQVQTLFLAQGIIARPEIEKIVAQMEAAKRWPVSSVLTHYDNRLDNLLVNGNQVTLLDWGLALAGIGIAQELIKIFEYAPYSMENPRAAAFLQGYGLAQTAYAETIERGKLMLVLDGLAMSYGWAVENENLAGIRAWLQTIKQICDEW